jgi:hypothetical protein
LRKLGWSNSGNPTPERVALGFAKLNPTYSRQGFRSFVSQSGESQKPKLNSDLWEDKQVVPILSGFNQAWEENLPMLQNKQSRDWRVLSKTGISSVLTPGCSLV